MRIALARVPECATARLALECDGALYDVALLEARRATGVNFPTDFHSRVVGLGGAGLADVVEQLRSGLRPSRARLGPADVVLLPPCDVDRAHAFQLGPHEVAAPHPLFRVLDARGLLADGETVALPTNDPHAEVEASIAVLLGDDLHLASAEEAARALFAFTLMLEWGSWPPACQWIDRRPWHQLGVQLGPVLVTADEVGGLDALAARVSLGEESWDAGPFGHDAFSVADSVAFLSRHVRLRAGDVVGLGRLRGARASAAGRALRPGAPFCVQAGPLGELRGRAAPAR